MARSQVQRRNVRIAIAALAAISLLAVFLGYPGHSRGAAADTQTSSNVAVVPGFAPPAYSGTFGLPAFPTGAPQLSAYHFSQLAVGNVTAAALKNYDTVILYGIRWRDIPTSAQAAINAFAATHKVLIWDSDDTGSQSYSTFIHPFSETASGENFQGKVNDSVVTYVSFVNFTNFLASENPSSPYYLDPTQLVTDRDELNDMNAMTTGTKNWDPALKAANRKIPNGGWPLAWSYGVIKNATGLTVYSGIDADAFGNSKLSPNYAIKELELQLRASFRTTPDPTCAGQCKLPAVGPTPPPHVTCSLAKPVPKHWVHGGVVLWLKTSVATGITGKVVSTSGRLLASGNEENGLIRFLVHTKRLPTNRVSRLKALVLVNGQQGCSTGFRLKVDNTRPRLLFLSTSLSGSRHLVQLRVSEVSSMTITGAHVPHRHRVLIAAHRTIRVYLPAKVRKARLTLIDRAGNKLVRRLVW